VPAEIVAAVTAPGAITPESEMPIALNKNSNKVIDSGFKFQVSGFRFQVQSIKLRGGDRTAEYYQNNRRE